MTKPEIRTLDGVGICAAEYGLTKREYAAIHIAAGMLASESAVAMLQAQSMHDQDENATFNITGRIAVKFADAILAALKGGE